MDNKDSFVYKKKRLKFGMMVVWIYIIVQVLMIAYVCSEPGESAVHVDSKGHERIRIVFWHAMGGNLGRTLDQLVKKFNSSQEEIWVDAQNMGNYSALSQKLIASILSGTTPDCAQAYEAWISKFILGKDVLVKLNDYIEKNNMKMEEFYPVMVENISYGKDIWALPFNKSFPLYYYNKEHMKRCGYDPDKFPESLSEIYKLFETAEAKMESYFSDFGIPVKDNENTPLNKYRETVNKILQKDPKLFVFAGIRMNKENTNFEETPNTDEKYKKVWEKTRDYIIDFRPTDFNPGLGMFENIYLQLGGVLDPQKGTLQMDVNPATDAILMLGKLLYKDKLATFTQAFDHQNNFVSGKLLAIQGSCVSKCFMEGQIRFDWAMAPLPKGVKSASVMQGTNVVIFNNQSEKRKQAAFKFISWFTENENTAFWSRHTNYLPVRIKASEEKVLKDYIRDYSSIHPEALIRQMDAACFEPRDSAWFKSRDILGQRLQDMMIMIEKKVRKMEKFDDQEIRSFIESEVKKTNVQIGEIYKYYQ